MDKADYKKMRDSSSQINENKDCAVVAAAIVTQSDYFAAHALLKLFGREDRKGTCFERTTKRAIESLGFKVERVENSLQENGSRYTPKTIGKMCKDGHYLCRVKGHIFAVVDGQVMDWTEGRRHRIYAVYKVFKNNA